MSRQTVTSCLSELMVACSASRSCGRQLSWPPAQGKALEAVAPRGSAARPGLPWGLGGVARLACGRKGAVPPQVEHQQLAGCRGEPLRKHPVATGERKKALP